MRDGNVYEMNKHLEKKIAIMYRQIQFLDTRIQAYESVMANRKAILKAFWNPSWLKKAVEQIQLALLKMHDEKVKQVVEEKKQEAMKPKIIMPTNIPPKNGVSGLVVALALMAFLPSCVSKKTYQKGIEQYHKEGYESAELKCKQEQEKTAEYIKSLVDRLRKFNQIASDGSLYPIKPKWKGSDDNDVTGKESWQK